MKRARAIVGLGAVALAVAGCGSAHTASGPHTKTRGPVPRFSMRIASSRRTLTAGFHQPAGCPCPSPTAAESRRGAKRSFAEWRTAVSTQKRPGLAPALTRHQFRRRLAAAAARYHFAVKRVWFVHAPALAPAVIVETRQYFALARAIHRFMPSLCPGGCANVFFEAQDERGVPFIAGNWLRSDWLDPYPVTHA